MIYVIGSDHAGFETKEAIRREMAAWGLTVTDAGVFDPGPADYPDIAKAVAEKVSEDPGTMGVLVCGSGVGMSIVANRFRGVRAALAFNVEVAELCRRHNDANVLVLPGRFLSLDEALRLVRAWVDTPFEGGRHQRRLDKIAALDRGL